MFPPINTTQHIREIKQAYCELLTALIDPLASLVTAEVNLPTLINAVALIFPKALRMSKSNKKPHSIVAIPLCASLLCIASKDLFSKNWSPVVDILLPKLRDKQLNHIVITGLVKLVWVYLFRNVSVEGSDVGQRKMEDVFRGVFPGNRRIIAPGSYDSGSLDYSALLVWYVCVRYQEFGTSVIFPLLLESGGVPLWTDNPERLIVIFKSFLLLLSSVVDSLARMRQTSDFGISREHAGSGRIILESLFLVFNCR
jgi:hypothetical protein